MTARPETNTYLAIIEQSVHKVFHYREEIATLIDLAESRNMKQPFDDLLFLAKFVSKARNILLRAGVNSDDTRKLAAEFKENLEKSFTLLRTLVKEAPEDVKESFTKKFFFLSSETMTDLLALLNELSWIKNYKLDNEQMPT